MALDIGFFALRFSYGCRCVAGFKSSGMVIYFTLTLLAYSANSPRDRVSSTSQFATVINNS